MNWLIVWLLIGLAGGGDGDMEGERIGGDIVSNRGKRHLVGGDFNTVRDKHG